MIRSKLAVEPTELYLLHGLHVIYEMRFSDAGLSTQRTIN